MLPRSTAIIVVGGAAPDSIGETITDRLLDDGHTIIRLDVNPGPFPPRSDRYQYLECDLTDSESIERATLNAVELIAHLGGLELLGVVYAAGSNHLGAVDDLDPNDFDHMVALNARGVYLVTQGLRMAVDESDITLCAPVKTIVLGSNTAFVAKTRSFGYAFTKAGLAHMLRCMHRELAPQGWEFTSLDFGIVMDSAMTEKTIRELGDQRGWSEDQAREMLLRNVPNHKPVTRDEIARTVEFLLHPAIQSFGGNSVRFDSGQQQG